jgi:serine/threonine protein kinase
MPPAAIGRYKIVRELGRGAMGLVYEARDPNIGRTVALKTIRLDSISTDPVEAARRFKNEARAAGGLNHPNIVTIYDSGEDEGLLYIAMELLEGSTLDALLAQQHSLPLEQTIAIIRQTCAGLDFAHSKGIIHRDIKPANIMLGAHGLVKITDFGIARADDAMTMTGQVLGTPHYMSPEQVLGKHLDGRSDLFSVGVMLYEMVTGERPFEAQNITTIMYKIVHENPIRPRELDSTIHPGLSTVVEKSLAKAPEARYQSGAELGSALQNYPQQEVLARNNVLQTATFTPSTTSQTSQSAGADRALPQHSTRPADIPAASGSRSEPLSGKGPWLVLLGAVLCIASFSIYYFHEQRSHGGGNSASETPASLPSPSPSASSSNNQENSEQPDTRTQGSPQALVQLQPPSKKAETATLNLNSEPPGASVVLDGKPTGKTTPARIAVPKGEHSVGVRLEGFQAASVKFRVQGGEEFAFSPQLAISMPDMSNVPSVPGMPDMSQLNKLGEEGVKEGQFWQKWAQGQPSNRPLLLVNSHPHGATILIDGKDTGKTTPAIIPTQPGSYHIQLRLDGFQTAERDVSVQLHHPGIVSVQLKPLSP